MSTLFVDKSKSVWVWFQIAGSPFAVGVVQDGAVCSEKATSLATKAANLLYGTSQDPNSDFYKHQFDIFTVAATI